MSIGFLSWLLGRSSREDDAPEQSEAAVRPVSVLTPDEIVARDMLAQHAFSKRLLEEDGELEAYKSLRVRPEAEARWMGAYIDGLFDGCANNPEKMDIALLLAAEYSDGVLLRRAVEFLDAAFGKELVPDDVLLKQCERALDLLEGDSFSAEPSRDACREQLQETLRRVRLRSGVAEELSR